MKKLDLEAANDWAKKGWSVWVPFDEATVRSLSALPGVYKIRTRDYSFARLRRQTSTVYIGSTERRDLAKRLNNLLKGTHVAGRRIQRIKQELDKDFEFRFRVDFAARQAERDLLRHYETDHLELLPCNHRGTRP